MTQNFSQQIKAARKQHGMTQEQLAARLHVTRQTVSHWENGRAQPSYDTLLQLAEVLELDLSALLKPDIPPEESRAGTASDQNPAQQETGAAEEAGMPDEAPEKTPRRMSSLSAVCLLLLAAVVLLHLVISHFSAPDPALPYSMAWFQTENSISIPEGQAHVQIYTRESSIPRIGEGIEGKWVFQLYFKEQGGVDAEVRKLRFFWFRRDGSSHTEVLSAGEFRAFTGSTIIGANEIRFITIGEPAKEGFVLFGCVMEGVDSAGHDFVFRMSVPLE